MNTTPTPTSPRTRPPGRRRAFTLTELLIVIGIIVLLVAIAMPAFDLIRGSRSIESAENQISAFLGVARAEAVGLQERRGVIFFVDAGTDRLVMAQVYYAPAPAPRQPGDTPAAAPPPEQIELFPGRDEMLLPAGVGLRAVPNTVVPADLPTDQPRRWDAFACIMFGPDGRLIQDPISIPDPNAPSAPSNPTRPNALSRRVKPAVAPVGGADGQEGLAPLPGRLPSPRSTQPYRAHIGFVLYDKPGFADQAPRPDAQRNAWLLDNSVPYLVNRYNGTLMRGQ